MPMSGDVTTQNLSLGGPAVLVALINAQNLIYLPTPLTTATITYNDPVVYGGVGANTSIVVGTNAPATYGAGTVNVLYTRVDLSTLSAQQPVITATSPTIASAVAAINSTYGLDLTQANVTQTLTTPLTANSDGSYTQQITAVANDLLYTGSQTFTFALQPPVVTAAFTSTTNYLVANFTDTSIDAGGTLASWAWDFGDGATATVQNPSHTYTANGTYRISLTATDTNGTAKSTVYGTVTVAALVPTLTAAFTVSSAGYTATFKDTSTDVNGTLHAWSWNFGDGSSSTLQNPTHAYPSAGTYTAVLTVTDINGTTSATTSQKFAIKAPVVTASFTQVTTNLSVALTDTSTDVGGTLASWAWNFGDSHTSTLQSPTHLYQAGGDYTIALTVTDADGITSSSTSQIVAPKPPVMTASFSAVATGLSVAFTDTSTDLSGTVAGWTWNFGDGSAVATTQNPTHVYTASGHYSVTLTIADANGETTATTTQQVGASSATLTAAFTEVATGLSVAFTDGSTVTNGTIGAWAWDFGDGTTSTVESPTHVYAATGTYTVKLTVSDGYGVNTATVQHAVPASNAVVTASFTDAIAGLSVAFTDTSTATNGTVGAWLWDFGDATATSTVRNPTHAYAAAGTYTVKLTATDATGLVSNQTSQAVTVA